jgi:hypothetical protein
MTQVFTTRDDALAMSNSWIIQNQLTDVAKPKWFVQKVPLNKIYNMSEAYLFVIPPQEVQGSLRQEAAELQTHKLNKIADLEDQLAVLKEGLVVLESGDVMPDLDITDVNYTRPPHPPVNPSNQQF